MIFWSLFAAAVFLLLLWIADCLGKLLCANRLGLRSGWMAFLPFLGSYLEGRMAEVSDRLLQPNKKRLRAWSRHNLTLRILCVVFGGIALAAVILLLISLGLALANKLTKIQPGGIIGIISMVINFINNGIAYFRGETTNTIVREFNVLFLVCAALLLIAAIIWIVALVVHYLVMYKYYTALSPKKSGMLLVLSFFLPLAATIIRLVLGFSRPRVFAGELVIEELPMLEQDSAQEPLLPELMTSPEEIPEPLSAMALPEGTSCPDAVMIQEEQHD